MGLRTLSVNEQVALLFVIMFGVLVLAWVIWFALSLRDMGEAAQQRHGRFARDLRAVWIGAMLFWFAWMSGPVGATLLFGIVSFLALREFITLMHTRRGDHRGLLIAFFVVLPIQFAIAGGRWFDLLNVFIPVYVFLAIPVISALAGDPQRFLERNAKIQWGIMVCVYGLSHAPAVAGGASRARAALPRLRTSARPRPVRAAAADRLARRRRSMARSPPAGRRPAGSSRRRRSRTRPAGGRAARP